MIWQAKQRKTLLQGGDWGMWWIKFKKKMRQGKTCTYIREIEYIRNMWHRNWQKPVGFIPGIPL